MSETPDPDQSTSQEPRRLPPLLRRVWYGLNQAFRQRIAHLAITPDQFSILRWLHEGDPAGLTQRHITDLMASDPNTITSTLARMEKAGLIVRRPHERDRRAHRVQLCEFGRSTFVQARDIALILQTQVLKALPEERREQFLEDLEVVADACASALEKPAPKKKERCVEAASCLSGPKDRQELSPARSRAGGSKQRDEV